MLTTVQFVLALGILGACTGFLAGLLGIGGGMLIAPVLTYLLSEKGLPSDLVVKTAIASSMAIIVFTAIASVRAHHRRGAIRWNLAAMMAPGVVLGSLLSSGGLFAYLKGSSLAIFFGLFVGFFAIQMFFDKNVTSERQLPKAWVLFIVGSAIGLISGLVGAGGGFISIPFLTWSNVAIHVAVATSAALGVLIAAVNVIGYVYSGWSVHGPLSYTLGYIWLPALAVVVPVSLFTAPMGVRAAHNLPVQQLKRVFSYLLCVLAIYMLYKGWTNI